jgi:1-acyl-sn-glycerol-3-phosphate acyltransferase
MLPLMTDQPQSARLYWLCRKLLKIGLRLYNRFEVRGVEHIPSTGGCVMAANHVSFLDPPAVGCAVSGRPVRFMARDTLLHLPGLGRILAGTLIIPISRERGDVGALKKAIEALRKGDCIGLFPEGTRSPDGQLKTAKGGIGFLLAKAAVPVIPLYVDGTYRSYPKGGRFIKPCKIRVYVGKPIDPIEIAGCGSGREAYEEIGKLVMSRIAALKPV